MARGISSTIRDELRRVMPESFVNTKARETGAVKRQRVVKIFPFVWNLVLGFTSGDKRTLAGLRRTYEKTTGQTIEESSFYNRFTPELVALLKIILVRALDEFVGVGRALRGTLAGFRDVILTDSTVIRLHNLLAKRFPACRTNHTQAALKAHVIISARGVGRNSVKFTAEREHDGPVFRVGAWVKEHLLLFDLGYFRYQLFNCIRRHGGFFLTRLKGNSNPLIVGLNRAYRGRAVDIVGMRLRDVVARIDREVLDVEIAVQFPRRRYRGRIHRDAQRLRVVGIRDAATEEYHLYVTNVPAERLSAEDVSIVYSFRWQIELLFKELKTYYRIEDLPSRKPAVVEALVYAALITMAASRRLLAAVRKRQPRLAQRLPEHRWAAIFTSVAQDLLLIATRRFSAVRQLLRTLTTIILYEAKDPNLKRHGLLRAVESGARQADIAGATR